MSDCHACRLSAGEESLPGGRVLECGGWLVEHCVGPLGMGALVVKPERHCESLADLDPDEAASLGPLLRRVSGVVRSLTGCDQVYCCLWSHSGWQPVHVHFVLQPAWNRDRERYSGPGPTLQSEMFHANELPDPGEVEAFCERARERLAAGGAAARG